MTNRPTPVVPPMLVVAVALIDAERRVLVQQRRFSTDHGGLWEFPGGKVEPGESVGAALVREIEEELAVTLAEGDIEPLTFATANRAAAGKCGGGEMVLMLYACRRWRGDPQPLDAERIAWVGREELPRLAMPPLDVELARTAIRVLM